MHSNHPQTKKKFRMFNGLRKWVSKKGLFKKKKQEMIFSTPVINPNFGKTNNNKPTNHNSLTPKQLTRKKGFFKKLFERKQKPVELRFGTPVINPNFGKANTQSHSNRSYNNRSKKTALKSAFKSALTKRSSNNSSLRPSVQFTGQNEVKHIKKIGFTKRGTTQEHINATANRTQTIINPDYDPTSNRNVYHRKLTGFQTPYEHSLARQHSRNLPIKEELAQIADEEV